MKNSRQRIIWLTGVAVTALAISISSPRTAAETAQQNSASATSTVVPRLIKSSGTLLDEQGHPLKSPVGVTFALYAQQSGSAALWLETQNVELDANGNYSVLLGVASANGVPAELFSSGEARWLGVQAERQPEQPRVLLVSVPYALKAGDAQTLGGLPANAFALAATPSTSASSSSNTTNIVAATQPAVAPATIGGTGTTDFIPLWTGSTTLGNSVLFQAPNNGIGIGTTAPAAKLDVNGGATIRGQLSLPFTGTATSTLAFDSQPLDLLASTFNSSTHAAVPQNFRWQAEPVGNNSTTPSGKLNLLFASGTATPAETGLSISTKGIITFAPGQTLPTITGNETVNGNLTATGSISGASETLSGSNSTILTVTQSSPGGLGLVANVIGGRALQGNASSTTAFTTGVFGEAASPNGFGVQGFNISGVGVLGFGSIGVKGWSTSAGGIAGFFQAANGASLLLGRNGPTTVLSMDGNGNLSIGGSFSTPSTVAAGVVTGNTASFSSSGTAIAGTSSSGTALFGTSAGFNGVQGVSHSSAGTGVVGINDGGWVGVYGQVPSGASTGQGVVGESFGSGCNAIGCSDGVHGIAHTTGGAGVAGINTAAGGAGIFASSPGGYGIVTDSNVQQSRTAGGWIKAMAVVDETISPVGPNQIVRCYNSQTSGASSSTPPCGFNMTFGRLGIHHIDFGFQVDDRFVQATPVFTSNLSNGGGVVLNIFPVSSSQVEIDTFYNGSGDLTDTTVYLLVF